MKYDALIIEKDCEKTLLRWALEAIAPEHKPLYPYIGKLQFLPKGINVIVYEERHDPLFPDWPVGRKYWTWEELAKLSK